MAPENQNPTLYDFLFIDYPRVQSIYSQLYSGLLSEISSLVSDTKSIETEMKAGGAPIGSLSSRRKEGRAGLAKLDRCISEGIAL